MFIKEAERREEDEVMKMTEAHRQGWTGRHPRINLRSEDKVNLTLDHVISYSLLMHVNCHYGYTVYCAHAYQTYVL